MYIVLIPVTILTYFINGEDFFFTFGRDIVQLYHPGVSRLKAGVWGGGV